MKAVILAGGLGTRLGALTELSPKPMVEIGGRPILWHILKLYGFHGIRDFVICLGYKGEVIRRYFAEYSMHHADLTFDLEHDRMEIHERHAEPWRVTLVETGPDTMTGGRLKRVARFLGDETFCMTYGDGLSNVDLGALVRFHRGHGKPATVTGVVQPGRFGVLDLEGERVTRFVEKPESPNTRINGGFFVLEPCVLETISGDSISWEQEPLRVLSHRDELRCYRHDGFWQAMDTPRDLRALEELWGAGRAPWKVW